MRCVGLDVGLRGSHTSLTDAPTALSVQKLPRLFAFLRPRRREEHPTLSSSSQVFKPGCCWAWVTFAALSMDVSRHAILCRSCVVCRGCIPRVHTVASYTCSSCTYLGQPAMDASTSPPHRELVLLRCLGCQWFCWLAGVVQVNVNGRLAGCPAA